MSIVPSLPNRAGDTLFDRGDPADSFYVVESGRLNTFADKDSDEVRVGARLRYQHRFSLMIWRRASVDFDCLTAAVSAH